MKSALAGAIAAILILAGNGFAQPIVGGFVEGVQALRIEKNVTLGDGDLGDRTYPRSEFRAQLTMRTAGDREELFVRTDIITDGTVPAEDRVDLDLREAYVKLRLAEWLDLKAGRQVTTWGTGDLIFANDLFVKNWEAFFTGLDDSYLKSPQNLLRVVIYTGGVTIDVAGSPYFSADNLPSGQRMSVYDPLVGGPVAAESMTSVLATERNLGHGEVFARASRSVGSTELALYAYEGFWPTPQGLTMREGAPALYHPRLRSIGASARGPIGAMLSHAEMAYYHSREDVDGDIPSIANSQVRGFAGMERSLGREWTAGVQYYGEWMIDHDNYETGLPEEAVAVDELRSTIAVRVTKMARQQTVQLSVFGYWGLSDEDWHLRPSVTYNVTDAVKWTLGASLVDGDRPDTMFGQFRGNSNLFTRLRYSF